MKITGFFKKLSLTRLPRVSSFDELADEQQIMGNYLFLKDYLIKKYLNYIFKKRIN